MISHVYKRVEEAEAELAKVAIALEKCWNVNEYEYLKIKREKLQKVLELNTQIYLNAITPIRHTKIKGFDIPARTN